jgi:hypothetical protein
MDKRPKSTVYDQVVRITHSYLGPAANRFVARQVENHLHKTPDSLSSKDLLSLTDWIRVAVSLLTEDSLMIEEYIAELRKLAHRYEEKGTLKNESTPHGS